MSLILLQVLISALFLAAIYALLAYGFNIIVGVTKVFDIAYGAVVMLDMLVLWQLCGRFGIPLLVGFIIILLLSLALGLLVNKAVIAPLLERGPLFQLIATFGVVLLIVHLCLYGWKAEIKMLPVRLPAVSVGGMTFGSSYILVFVASLIVFLLLTLFLTRTTTGCRLRAVAQDLVGAQVVGINYKRVYLYAMLLGYLLGGISAFLLSFIFPITPSIALDFITIAIVVVVTGGEGSFRGTAVASLILAFAHCLLGFYATTEWGTIAAFFILLLVLLLRPQGLFGEKA